jgi:hypothetical protein
MSSLSQKKKQRFQAFTEKNKTKQRIFYERKENGKENYKKCLFL